MATIGNTMPFGEKPRVRYIDALRGFTMFLVVFHHIELFGLNLQANGTVLGSIFVASRMPMFFFISGYIAYKAMEKWNVSMYAKTLAKRSIVLLVPTFVFSGIYFSANVAHRFADPWPGGYWFTLVLFEMFLIYFTLAVISHYLRKDLLGFPFWIAALVFFFTFTLFLPENNWWYRTLFIKGLGTYLHFFAFGILCRKYGNRFLRLVTNQYVMTAVVLLFVAGLLLRFNKFYHPDPEIDMLVQKFVIRYMGLLAVFALFHSKRHFFEGDNRFSKAMQYVGKHTLDIYLLHYFLLPHLKMLRPVLCDTANVVISLVLVGGMAVATIALCLLISNILRSSEFLAHYLFANKSKKFPY